MTIYTIAQLGPPLANHLWQSTIFAAAAGVLTVALRKNHARTRHCIWMAASLKFLVPLSLLIGIGGQVGPSVLPSVMPATQAKVSAAVAGISQPFDGGPVIPAPAVPLERTAIPEILLGLWAAGAAGVAGLWFARWRRIRAAVQAGMPLPLDLPVRVMSSPALLEPGVFGLLRPVLLLPSGIEDRLTPAQLRSVLAHELCHVKRRDNLAAAAHMAVQAIFWFHPLLWWLGARLVEERERACDEEVLRTGSAPEVYAEGILNVCKFYLESPLACASGVSGADLKKRIEAIMSNRIGFHLTPARKLLLAGAAAVAVLLPIFIGIVCAPTGRAQSQSPAPVFEVASIKPANPDNKKLGYGFTPDGGVRISGVPLKGIITFAYDIQAFQLSGGPGWSESERYDIVAKGTGAGAGNPGEPDPASRAQARLRLQALLADRFQLVLRRGTKEVPVYNLVVGKTGSKMKETELHGGIRQNLGELLGTGASMSILATVLARNVGRPVVDMTGLTGNYEFRLSWLQELPQGGFEKPGVPAPAPEDATGPSIFTALQEQLGLKLESLKGPVETIIIESASKPAAN